MPAGKVRTEFVPWWPVAEQGGWGGGSKPSTPIFLPSGSQPSQCLAPLDALFRPSQNLTNLHIKQLREGLTTKSHDDLFSALKGFFFFIALVLKIQSYVYMWEVLFIHSMDNSSCSLDTRALAVTLEPNSAPAAQPPDLGCLQVTAESSSLGDPQPTERVHRSLLRATTLS